MSIIQVRGNCQICGRLHAYTRGATAAHGYTVKNGWFEGVCSGQNFQPMQLDRSQTDKCCASIRLECDGLDAKAIQVEAREILPPPIKSCMPGKAPTPFAEASKWEQDDAVKSFAWSLRRRAEMGRGVANDIESLATRVHGTPLIEAKREVAAAAIKVGERRSNGYMTLVCTEVAGARIHWKADGPNGRAVKGWTGSSAWRRFTPE